MNNNLLLIQQLFKQTLTQFFFNSFVMSQHIILKMHIVKYDHEIHRKDFETPRHFFFDFLASALFKIL